LYHRAKVSKIIEDTKKIFNKWKWDKGVKEALKNDSGPVESSWKNSLTHWPRTKKGLAWLGDKTKDFFKKK